MAAIPDSVFSVLLNQVEDADELRVVLYAVWRMSHMDRTFHAISAHDFIPDALGMDQNRIHTGLEKAVADHILLLTTHGSESLYLTNSPRGRANAQVFANGSLEEGVALSSMPLERSSIYKLYEENIGPLTPLIADTLKEAEATFEEDWITDAILLAVRNNKRNWSYCEAILKRWKEEGRGEKQNRRDDPESRRRDVQEKIRKFVGG